MVEDHLPAKMAEPDAPNPPGNTHSKNADKEQATKDDIRKVNRTVLIIFVVIVAIVSLPIVFGGLMLLGYGIASARFHSGPPVKEVTFHAKTLAMILPDKSQGNQLRILVFDGQPFNTCKEVKLTAIGLGNAGNVSLQGNSYPVLYDWQSKVPNATAFSSQRSKELRIVGGAEIGMRPAFKSGVIKEPAASQIGAGNCSVLVIDGGNRAYIAPIEPREHYYQLQY